VPKATGVCVHVCVCVCVCVCMRACISACIYKGGGVEMGFRLCSLCR
jgi:hypothetical protein